MKRFIYLYLCLFMGSANAAIIDTTSAWDGSEYIGYFAGTTTYGQTFNLSSGTDTFLDSISVYFDTRGSDLSYRYYLYQWGGSNVSGAALFSSDTLSLNSNGMAEQLLSFGGIELETLIDYVFFVSEWGVDNLASINATMGAIWDNNAYARGQFVYDNADYTDVLVTDQTWNTLHTNEDLAFQMNLSDGSTTTPAPIPEPTTLALLGLGFAGIGFLRKKKKY